MTPLTLRCLLLFLAGCLSGTIHAQRPVYLSADSLQEGFFTTRQWRFQPGDNLAWAAPDCDDRAWPQVYTGLTMPDAERKWGFRGIGWFRMHFVADSTLVALPLAYSFTQQGASIVYLDGKPLDTFGIVGNARTSRYYDPCKDPGFFVLTTPGPHVLAMRYANFRAAGDWDRYGVGQAGFSMQLGIADVLAAQQETGTSFIAGFTMLLFGLFLALAVLHFLLFLYNRRYRPHLLFALFSLCLALIGPLAFLFDYSYDPQFANRWGDVTGIVPFGACFFLSAFLNSVFPLRRRWLLWAIIAVCAAGTVTLFLPHVDHTPFLFAAVALVAVEAVVVTVRAMLRRQPGARILGAGFLLFAVFILSIFILLGLGVTSVHFGGSDGAKFWVILLLATLVILSIPLSISAFLAWSVARTNKDLKLRLDEVAALSEQTRRQEEEKQRLLQNRQEELEREVALRTDDLRRQKQRSDDLLLNILPAEVAEELKEKGQAQARQFSDVSVLFTDFAGFTQVSERLSPQVLVQELHACFTAFDAIIEKYGLEKIKTIGDAYLAVCGLPVPDAGHAANAVRAALEIRDFMAARTGIEERFAIRIGIHSGPVVAGIVGVKKFAYDIWGDTVNTAARMEQSGEPGKVNVSEATYQLVQARFHATHRGKIAAKGKGDIDMYFIDHAAGPTAPAAA